MIGKKNLVINYLIDFIKELIVLKNKKINMPFKSFYQNYISYVDIVYDIKINDKMIDIQKQINNYFGVTNFYTPNKKIRCKYISISHEKLLEIFEKNDWIDEFDIFDEQDKKKSNNRSTKDID